MSSYPQLFLNSKQAKYFDGRHPWVLERSVVDPTVALEAGQIVELVQANGSWIGRGIYNPNSRIRVRLYQWEREQSLDADWLRQQLALAVGLRDAWQESNNELQAVRLVNSEGDGLSGLIVDRFANFLIVQITSYAMHGWLEEIKSWLVERFCPAGIFVSIDGNVAKHEGLEPGGHWAIGEPPTSATQIEEHGVRIAVDLNGGQKTGYYLDQRQNRLRAAKWTAAGPMLDVCTYQGGFSLAACRHGSPTEVLAVDSSNVALEIARANAEANGFSHIEFAKADCFDYVQQLAKDGRQFQTVVLDPPRMASTRNQIAPALRAYHRLNLSAINLLQPGGILVTCSCSGRVSRSDFIGVLSSAAKRSRRRVQIVESLSADFDHPFDANCPETDYLKCLICRVS